MKILIPTRGRPNQQHTAKLLSEARIPFTLVPDTYHDVLHLSRYDITLIPATNIVEKRQAIIDQFGNDKLVMLDDDMKIYTRENGRYQLSTSAAIDFLFNRIERELDTHVHVGTASRFMANYRAPDHEMGGRYIRLLAYNFQLMSKSRPKYRFPGHEDHDFNLQLQALGYIPKVLTCFAQDDHGQFNPGGCSLWRTPQSDIEEMKRFAAAWPGVVTFGQPNERYPGGRMRIAWNKLRQPQNERKQLM